MQFYGPFYPSNVTTDGYDNPNNAKTESNGEATYSGSAGDGRELHASGFGAIVPEGMRLKQITLGVNVTTLNSSGVTSPAIDSLHVEKGGSLLADPELHGVGLGVNRYEITISGLDVSRDDANASDFGVGFIFYDNMGESTGTFNIGVDSLYIKEIGCE